MVRPRQARRRRRPPRPAYTDLTPAEPVRLAVGGVSGVQLVAPLVGSGLDPRRALETPPDDAPLVGWWHGQRARPERRTARRSCWPTRATAGAGSPRSPSSARGDLVELLTKEGTCATSQLGAHLRPGHPGARRRAAVQAGRWRRPPRHALRRGLGRVGLPALRRWRSRRRSASPRTDSGTTPSPGTLHPAWRRSRHCRPARDTHQSVLVTPQGGREAAALQRAALPSVRPASSGLDHRRTAPSTRTCAASPWAALHVNGSSFWSYAVLGATCALGVAAAPTTPRSTSGRLYRAINGEHELGRLPGRDGAATSGWSRASPRAGYGALG